METSRTEEVRSGGHGDRYIATMGVIIGKSLKEINNFLDYNRLNRLCFRRVSTPEKMLGLPRNSVVWILNVNRVELALVAMAENRFDHVNYLED